MNKLIELLRAETKEIAASFEKASIEGAGTPQEVADRREEVIKKFLRPQRILCNRQSMTV